MGDKKITYELIINNSASIKSMKDLIDSQKALKKEILSATDVGTERYNKLKETYTQNQTAIRDFNRELNGSRSLSESVADGMIKAFTRVGAVIAASFTIGAVADFAQGVLELTRTLDESFAKVNTIAQLSGKEFDDLKSRVIAIGAEGGTELEKVPEAFQAILQANGDVDESLKILEASVKAADVGFGDLQTTAEAGVNILNTLGDSTKDINDVYNILAVAQKEGALNFEQLNQILPKIIPTAKSVGFSLEETAAALTTLSRQGFSAEQSGKALKTFFQTFANEASLKKIDKGLASIGGSIFDSAGQMKDFNVIIGEFSTLLKSAGTEQEQIGRASCRERV